MVHQYVLTLSVVQLMCASGQADSQLKTSCLLQQGVSRQQPQGTVSNEGDAGSHPEDLMMVQIEREKVRQDEIVRYFTKFWKMMISGAVKEGMGQDDAISLMRGVASGSHLKDWERVDLHSDKSLHEVFAAHKSALHEFTCYLRKEVGDCETEFEDFVHGGLKAIPGAMFVQEMVGLRAEEKALVKPKQGLTSPDSDLSKGINLLKNFLSANMVLNVKIGEHPDVVKHAVADAMGNLAAMDAHSLLEYVGYSKGEIAREYLKRELKNSCVAITGSCSEQIHRIMTEYVDTYAPTPSGVAGVLLQAGLRPAAHVVMKMMGLPEFPEETATERNAGREAYLAQRKLQR